MGSKCKILSVNGCHDLTMLFLNISNIAIITVKRGDYCFIIHDIIKSKVINLVKDFALDDRGYI